MFSKDDFLATAARETEVCCHLNDKLTGDQLTYRPAQGMRGTLELLQYLTYCALVPAEAIIENDWSRAKQRAADAKRITASSFSEHMKAQQTSLERLVGGLSEAELRDREVSLPWGETSRLGPALVRSSLCFLTAYRMQLFVYAKASGSQDLVTSNCWRGMDPPVPEGR